MGGLFSKPKLPPVKPPSRMPVENDEETRQARLREQQRIQSQSGRSATDLASNETDLLGK